MKLIDTQLEKNKLIENDNHRSCIVEVDCHTMRTIIDGIQKVIQGKEKIQEKAPEDIEKEKWLKEVVLKEWRNAYMRTKRLIGVNIEIADT